MSQPIGVPHVQLVSLTHPLEFRGGPEDLIAYVARVSNPANQDNRETAPRLLRYLIENKHWSPFEHVSMTLRIETSRGIAAQILRHRSFVFQELSQRYAPVDVVHVYPARRQDSKNRQNSIDDLPEEDRTWFLNAQTSLAAQAMARYQEALARGVAKEQARFLLPLSTATVLYMTGNVRSWIHYLELRSGNGTQLEHQEIALKARGIFTMIFPATSEALGWKEKDF